MSLKTSLRNIAGYYLKRRRQGQQASGEANVLSEFISRAAQLQSPRVLELGTKRLHENQSTLHRGYVPHAREFLGTDFADGSDVDLVADVHTLSETVGAESFDVIISCSTFEHFKYPQLAAHQIMKTLAVGGLLFIQTHQTYPLHGAPNDYFRFSHAGLAALFSPAMGMNVVAADHEFPARIVAGQSSEVKYMTAFLNSRIFAEKIRSTPETYVYDLGE